MTGGWDGTTEETCLTALFLPLHRWPHFLFKYKGFLCKSIHISMCMHKHALQFPCLSLIHLCITKNACKCEKESLLIKLSSQQEQRNTCKFPELTAGADFTVFCLLKWIKKRLLNKMKCKFETELLRDFRINYIKHELESPLISYSSSVRDLHYSCKYWSCLSRGFDGNAFGLFRLSCSARR